MAVNGIGITNLIGISVRHGIIIINRLHPISTTEIKISNEIAMARQKIGRIGEISRHALPTIDHTIASMIDLSRMMTERGGIPVTVINLEIEGKAAGIQARIDIEITTHRSGVEIIHAIEAIGTSNQVNVETVKRGRVIIGNSMHKKCMLET